MTNNELNISPETVAKLQALQDEYKPRIVTALQELGLQIADDISDEELEQVLNDQATFESKLPEGKSLADFTPEDFAPLQEIVIELTQKAQEILLEELIG